MNAPLSSPARKQRAALLDWLRENLVVEESAISRAEIVSVRTGQPVEQVLNHLGALSDDDLVHAYAHICRCEIWDPIQLPPSVSLEDLGVSVEYLRRSRILPLEVRQGRLVCATCDPLDDEALSGLIFATGRAVAIMAASPADWRRGFEAAFPDPQSAPVATDERRLEREIDQVSDGSTEGAGARLVAGVFEAAIAAGASDIHFEPRRHDLQIRLRVDGRLIPHQIVSADLAAPAVSRVKVIANLDLGERRLPQDGRTTFVVGGRQIDVRVATSPTVFGEAAVLRILDRTKVSLDLGALGLPENVVGILRRAARAPHGMFLVTGPTGSGKTTTLYAVLQTFAGSAKKVLSVEDPVEYHFEHVVQTQVAPQLGLTFASVLRSFLRQDPDVILVGEIRDPETAAVAVQAAMTGHFVLASVHANSAPAVVPRLLDMGIEPYQLAAGFRGAAAQRLVRRLCPDCSVSRPAKETETAFAAAFGVNLPNTFDARGCPACKQTGYKGRIAIGEAFLADEQVLRAVAEGAPAGDLASAISKAGFGGMACDGLAKAAQGVTSVEEVMAVVDG